MDNINTKCQVFTPYDIVNEVLNILGYQSDLYGKKILENSCGDGSFLIEIVDRYIKDCLNTNIHIEKIVYGLENDIYGIEIDNKHIKNCKKNLEFVANKYGISNVRWNIIKGDFLDMNINQKFQYVVGNPPYITYLNLNMETRKYIKNNFETCIDGKPDYYYAFIEKSIKELDDNGKLAYLIPNNIFKNRFANKLRQYMLPNLTKIVDYKSKKLFKSKLISSAIILYEQNNNSDYIAYFDKVNNVQLDLLKSDLGEKWILNENNSLKSYKKMRFGNDFKSMSPIATLLNEAFIIKDYEEYEDYIFVKGYRIEKSILREAVSPRSLQYVRKEFIIFPYHYTNNNELLKYSENEFKNLFPEAFRYLQSFNEKLEKRDKDDNAKWFEFGRSQALGHINQEKLLLSTLVTNEVKVHHISKNQVPYAGIVIYPNGKSLEMAESILNSDEFLKYINNIGINASGTTMRISARDVNNFEYTVE